MRVWVKIRLGPRRQGAQRADDEVAEAVVALCDAPDGLSDALEGGYVLVAVILVAGKGHHRNCRWVTATPQELTLKGPALTLLAKVVNVAT
jgi:hypothetical protein